MKKRIITLAIALLLLLSGCGEQPKETKPGTEPPQASTDAVIQTQPTPSTEVGETTAPTEDEFQNSTEYEETYHSGKPYTPWGVSQTITFALEGGRRLTVTGNVPEENDGILIQNSLWWAATNDMNMAYMVAYISAEQYDIQSPDSFFEDMGEQFTDNYYKKFRLAAKNAVLDIRGANTVTKKGIRMNRTTGVAQWKVKNEEREDSFVAYVFQTPDGDYLCCLFQCTKKDWPVVQEAAENFVNTLQWGDPNAS